MLLLLGWELNWQRLFLVFGSSLMPMQLAASVSAWKEGVFPPDPGPGLQCRHTPWTKQMPTDHHLHVLLLMLTQQPPSARQLRAKAAAWLLGLGRRRQAKLCRWGRNEAAARCDTDGWL